MESNKTPTEGVSELITRLKVAYGIGTDAKEQKRRASSYVIYARRSQNRSEQQERSIDDQIAVCQELASAANLGALPMVIEQCSAKISGNRPKFDHMLEDIEKRGIYDGIITWAPDRLARNMKEAGMIIDLLDKGVIKDIRFANGFTFSNDSAGKMLLGIAFVMAKQYSDQHSQDVKRAVNRITNEGKIFDRPKYGYYKDKNGFARPDGENWTLLKKAFSMRLIERMSLDEIAKWLVGQRFPRKTEHRLAKPVKVNKNFLSDIFRDPFYTGILLFGDQAVDLTEKYDFVPMITPSEFDSLIKEDGLNKRFTAAFVIKKKDTISADLLRGLVTCGECLHPMGSSITIKRNAKGEISRYYYFRCMTGSCARKPRNIRAHVITEAVYDFLDKRANASKKAYERYLSELKEQKAEDRLDLDKELRSLVQQASYARKEIQSFNARSKAEKGDVVLRKEYKRLERESLKKHAKISLLIEELKKRRELLDVGEKSFEEFVELFQKLAKHIKKIDTMRDLDAMLRKLFTNFVIEGKKVAQITQSSLLRELYDTDASALVDLVRIHWNPIVTEMKEWLEFGKEEEMAISRIA